jgi:D-3-phosphoglycerate dehydrogenase
MPHRILLCRALHPAGMALLAERGGDLDIVTLHDPPVEQFHQHLSSADAVLCWLERETTFSRGGWTRRRSPWRRG